jgi:hypothetical protein
MRIERAVASIHRNPDSWVRLEAAHRIPRGLVITFGIYKGRRGARLEAWRFTCSGVLEAKITAMDGGGLRLYSSSHPAARQFVAPQAELRWSGPVEDPALIGALYKAHIASVDDWIAFETYSQIVRTGNDESACRGPDFLMRAYAKALRAFGKETQVILRRTTRKLARSRVLHFGDSYVVSNSFVADKCDN